MSAEISTLLEHHWAMDTQAADVLAGDLSYPEQQAIAKYTLGFSNNVIELRDRNRAIIGDIYTGDADEILVGMGPCSLDRSTRFGEFFMLIHNMQERHPKIRFAFRGNHGKPRSGGAALERGGDWTGEWHSTDPLDRKHLFDVYNEALAEGIPILTEVTGQNQLGALAPYLSSFWLGARDMPSTNLRTNASAIHLPVGIKNGLDGKLSTVEGALVNIGRSSADNSGSGADLGTFASSPTHRGIPSGILPVGEGNKRIGIIARGHELPASMTKDERRQAALNHISELCVLASEHGSSVMLDGSHGVPPMFDIDRKDGDRFPRVMREIFQAVSQGEIEKPEMIRGLMFEIGPNVGRTDPNWVVTEETADQLSEIMELLPRRQGVSE